MAARAARGIGHQGPLYRAAHVGPDVARSCYSVHAETAANAYPFNRDNPSMDTGYRVGMTERGEEVLFDPTAESLRNNAAAATATAASLHLNSAPHKSAGRVPGAATVRHITDRVG